MNYFICFIYFMPKASIKRIIFFILLLCPYIVIAFLLFKGYDLESQNQKLREDLLDLQQILMESKVSAGIDKTYTDCLNVVKDYYNNKSNMDMSKVNSCIIYVNTLYSTDTE